MKIRPHRLRHHTIALFLGFLSIASLPLSADNTSPVPPAPETPAQRDARMAWWVDARFGMFIHWDMSSVAGTEISWSRKGSKPLDIRGGGAGYVEDPVYDHLYEKFDPEQFDAAKWVKLAQDAGMKYIVFTAKHHGGFCMWDTKLTDYSIMHTPFHRDVVKELADACHAAHMRFGIYYSPRDWHNPDYGIGDNSKYVAYMNGQLRELLTNYGKVDILWFDSYGHGDLVKFWKVGETWSLIKSLQPDIIINNRLTVLGGYDRQPMPYRGDMDTPEQRVGSFQNTRPWESCMSVVSTKDGGGWSYRPDGKVKPFSVCLRALVSCATGDGNLLLDVGPNAQGVIPDDQAAPLLSMGEWLRKYGVSIYGTRGGPFRNGAWGGSTFKDNTLYLHVVKWNGDHLDLPPLKSKIVQATCLTNPTSAFGYAQTDTGIALTLPAAAQDAIDTVIALQLSGPVNDEMLKGKPLNVAVVK
jgi:alpha-L-fucosidase